jgi:hypothetical protein
MQKNDTLSLFLLVTISFIATAIVILSWCSCFYGLPERFQEPHVCSLPGSDDCTWAAQQIMGLLDSTHHPDKSRAFLPKDDNPDIALKFNQLRNTMIGHAMHQIRQTKDFIIFFTDFEFRGNMYLLPAVNHTWNSEMRTEAFATPPDNPSHFEEFVEQFNFYYGRKFSCIVPEGVVVTIKPVQGGSYPGEPVVIGQGKHAQLVYHKGSVERVAVEIITA